MIRRSLVLACCVLISLLLVAGVSPALAETSKTSETSKTYEIEGGKLRIALAPDWPAVMVGEPLYLSLGIENLGSHAIWYGDGSTRNPLGRPDFLTLEVEGEDGGVLPVVDPGPSFGGRYGRRTLKPGERQTKRLFLPHWASIETPGAYTITCRRTYEFYDAADAETTRTLDVALSTAITVDPHDPAKIPAVLDRWSRPLRGPDTDAASEATRALSVITDPRVITPLQMGIRSGHYGIMFPCIRALAKFEEEEALAGLERAMHLQTADLKGMPNPVTAAQLLSNLRSGAAGTMAQSRHPQARALLRSFEEDPDPSVRLNVVHAAGAHGEAEDVALLERRKADANELVRGEAERYLRLLTR